MDFFRQISRFAWLVLPVMAVASVGASAEARVEDSSVYTKEQTFSGALRYLRVDLGYEITERDPDAAYLLFQFVPSGQKEPTHGSIEIIQAEKRVKVYVQMPKMPEYHERMLVTGLMKKLKTEYGEPPKPEKKRPSRDKKDEESGDEEDKDGSKEKR